MNILIDLFLTFAKIGLFTFGGGYAMISVIENNCVERKQWITHDEMMDVTVIAESARRKILCKRFSTKSRMALESRADSGLNPLITESHGGQNGMRAGTA